MAQGIPTNLPSSISVTQTAPATMNIPTATPPSFITGKGGTSIVDAAQSYDVLQIINRGLAYAIIIAGFLSVVFIFVGGISFILSGGQEEKIKSAVSTIRYAIIGLIITILATVIIGTVGKAMGLDIIRYINFGEIIDTIKSITSSGGTGAGPSLD
ncbi:MAG: hypothetical protein WC285_02965 [Candidatus Gracilibacteria bacterium]|jgi:hypothetical protein